MYLTREEDIWMISCIVLVLVIGVLRNWLREGAGSVQSGTRSALIRAVCIAAGIVLFVGPVLALNYKNYGRAIISEFRAPEFKAAVGALMRVGDVHPSGYVFVSQAAMQAVLENVPVAGVSAAPLAGLERRTGLSPVEYLLC